jgi:DNA-binding HxlR family transcriptional regulator
MSTASRTRRTAEPVCSIERCLQVLSDRWSFLILREALLNGVTRFADFERALGIAPNVLTNRLETIVKAGVLVKRAYQEPGSRTRFSYHPTQAGVDLAIPLAALQQWGDEHNAAPDGPTVLRRSPAGKPVRVGFLDDAGEAVPLRDVAFVKTAAYPE